MFESTRLKLTLWYALISLLISLFFSVTIFQILKYNLQDSFLKAQHRFDIDMNIDPHLYQNYLLQREEINQGINRLKLNLIYENLAILIIATGAGYILAGRTLRPIKMMLDEQNRFIADASHELRTPLTSLKTSIEVNLRDQNLTLIDAKNELKHNLSDINSLKYLSDNLLSLVQYSQNVVSNKFTLINFSKIVNEAVKKTKPIADNKNIKINVNSKPVKLIGSAEKLRELIVIFLDNAIKYSQPKNEININTQVKNSELEFSIEDHGIGIAKRDLPHIFDRFYRSDKSRNKENIPGYGLGLSIAREIVDLHRGSIQVKSQIKKGTTFMVKLPIK